MFKLQGKYWRFMYSNKVKENKSLGNLKAMLKLTEFNGKNNTPAHLLIFTNYSPGKLLQNSILIMICLYSEVPFPLVLGIKAKSLDKSCESVHGWPLLIFSILSLGSSPLFPHHKSHWLLSHHSHHSCHDCSVSGPLQGLFLFLECSWDQFLPSSVLFNPQIPYQRQPFLRNHPWSP